MAKTYYSYWYRLNGTDSSLIWYTDESDGSSEADGVLLDEAGRMPAFRRLADLQSYADRRGLPVESEMHPGPLDLDAVRRWLETPRKTTVDCETFLNAWNLFSDLASAIRGEWAHIDECKEDRIYDKLFFGCNLPAMTPPGEHYEPVWTKSEVGRMRNVLATGMDLFRDGLTEQPNG